MTQASDVEIANEPVGRATAPQGPDRPFELAGAFTCQEHRLAYTEYGAGEETVVLLHGLMLTRRMHAPLARTLARQGYRVITLDLLGHGDSDRPGESWKYSLPQFADQTVALLDHLEIDRAVVCGTSLGANVALEMATACPGRLRGIVTEMPVLDNAIIAGLLTFAPMLFVARFLPVSVHGLASVVRLIPRGYQWVDVITETLSQRPEAMAAMLHGVLFGRVAPPRAARKAIAVPTLVIGHQGDPIHPFGDADTLAEDLPDAEFVHARSPVELRLSPARLTKAISGFIRRCTVSAASAPRARQPGR